MTDSETPVTGNSRKSSGGGSRLLGRIRDPVTVAVLTGLTLCLAGKLRWSTGAADDAPGLLRLLSADLVFLGGFLLAADLLRRAARFRGLTWLLFVASLPLVVLCFFEAVSLSGTGTPLHVSSLRLALARWDDVAAAGDLELGVATVSLWGLLCLLPIGLSSAAFVLARHRRKRAGLFLSLGILVLGLLFKLGPAGPGTYGEYRQHVTKRLLWQLWNTPQGRDLATLHVLGPIISGERGTDRSPNIVLIILEGIGYEDTSLADPSTDRTPFLAQLGQRGMTFDHVRATTPHTSKALYGILCGRYPVRNWELVEAADNFPVACLPQILGGLGYRSAFLQSADGTFEQRPRLIHHMGFDSFVARQDFEPPSPVVGYVAGDDHELISAAMRTLGASKRPAFVTLLTSITHHPYVLPPSSPAMEDVNAISDAQRRFYATIQYSDSWLGALFQELARESLLDNTVFFVLADHGEVISGGLVGRGHSNVLSETVQRVPFVVWGEAIGPTARDETPRSLVDVAPTVLDLLEVERPPHFEGSSLFAPPPPNRWLLSASWFPEGWLTAVREQLKVVWFVERDQWVNLQLPAETETQGTVDPEASGLLERWRDETYFDLDTAVFTSRTFYAGKWSCDEVHCWRTDTGAGLAYDPGDSEQTW